MYIHTYMSYKSPLGSRFFAEAWHQATKAEQPEQQRKRSNFARLRWSELSHNLVGLYTTVDGRYPAPVDRLFIPFIHRLSTTHFLDPPSFCMLAGWWFGTCFFHILGIIIPTDFHIFQRGGSTTKQ